jgi:tRNA (guanosine-2'-O-)-methyltransferase
MSETNIYTTEFLEFISQFLMPERVEIQNQVLEERTRHITAVVEDVYQAHNASAVIRTCDCFGLQDMYIIEEQNRFKISKNIALGSGQWVNLCKFREQENNTLDCIKDLKKKGYKIVATTPHTDKSIYDLDITEPVALVFGNEKRGISPLMEEHADELVKIPMYGFTESFNISVSAALCLSILVEKMRASDIAWQLSEEEKNILRVDWAKSRLGSIEKYIFEFERLKALAK